MAEKRPRFGLLLFLGAGLLLAPVLSQPTLAQVLYGSLVGTVSDPTGAVVPGAKVVATHRGTNQTRETTTDDQGRFVISNAWPGNYDVTISAAGFQTYTESNILVSTNVVSRVEARLQVGAVTETVTVEASAAVLQTEKGEVNIQLGERAVNNLPLPRYRNYQSLINLVPGAVPTRFQNAVIDSPARALTTNVNGTNRNNNTTRIDGAANVFIWLPHHSAYVAPAETVQEVNITTNAFDAEQGMAGGASINVSTKSGTNELHGSAFWLHEDNALRARNIFLPQTQRKPKTITNITGFTIGGPIKRDKVFFFGGWEGTRERNGRFLLSTVPTAQHRTGDFSDVSTVIYDPSTGNPDGTDRQPFAGNMLPSVHPVAQQMLSLVPLPNLPGLTENYFSAGTQRFNRDNFDVKVNYNRTDRHTIWGKYGAMDAQVSCIQALGAAGGPGLCDVGNGTGDTLVQVASVGHTWTLSPNFLIDGTIGWTRMGQEVLGPDHGPNFGLDTLGIPGTNGPDPRESGMPAFAFTTYTTLGQPEGWIPIFRNDQSYTFTQNANWVKGSHDLRFGIDVVHHHLNHWQPELGRGPRGAFTFGGAPTALNGGPSPNQFNSLAAFLLGMPTEMGKSTQFIKMTGLEWQWAGYARDRWRVTPKLTFNYGVRYEYYPLMQRASSGIEFYDPATNLVHLGGIGGNEQNLGITTSKKLFAPRVGLAYRLRDNTVIRSGYGITFNPMPLARPLRGFYPLTIASDFVATGFDPILTDIQDGIPAICCPDISSGVIPLPLPALMRTPERGLLKRGYIQSWNFIIEQRLPSDTLVSVGYVGTRTIRSFGDIDINAARGVGVGNAGRPLNALHGRNTSTLLWQGRFDTDYHSLQVAINRPFKNGLLLKGAYTWSKAINWTDDDGWAGINWNDPAVAHRSRALAGYDIPHLFTMGFVYELPFGRDKAMASDGAAAAILGGWQINGTFLSTQGRPFTVTAPGASLNSPGNLQTADQVKPTVQKIGDVGPGTRFFDPDAFAPVTEVRYGTSGRNIMRGPGAVNLDFSLYRTFRLTEKLNFQFRAEAFNLTNTPHFANPAANASSPSNFMRVTSTDPNLPERQFRMGLRFSW
jgi:hypothetical protein